MNLSQKQFFFEDGLYAKRPVSEEDWEDVYRLLFYASQFDAYCPHCKRESIIQLEPVRIKRKIAALRSEDKEITKFEDLQAQFTWYQFSNHEYRVNAKCLREKWSHHFTFIVQIDGSSLFKIGQYPSVAEVTSNFQAAEYRTILPDSKVNEFNKAIGLNAHGVGIGAFVYLRRIFEHLLEESHVKAASDELAWDEPRYTSARVSEKVELLKDHLPKFFVENKSMYGLLSLGIHELDDETCLGVFPLLRSTIEMILDRRVAERQKQLKEKDSTRMIKQLSERLNKTKTNAS